MISKKVFSFFSYWLINWLKCTFHRIILIGHWGWPYSRNSPQSVKSFKSPCWFKRISSSVWMLKHDFACRVFTLFDFFLLTNGNFSYFLTIKILHLVSFLWRKIRLYCSVKRAINFIDGNWNNLFLEFKVSVISNII